MSAIALFAFACSLSHAKQTGTPAPAIVIEGLGKGTAALSGPCQFHLGDNPAWAAPAFDDSSWEQLSTDRSWSRQGHARYTGFAWYRCSIQLNPAPGIQPQFSLLIPRIRDAYEVYWNGSLIGRNGRLQPYPVWYDSQPAQIFNLVPSPHGVLAIRVWKAPLLSDDSGTIGGFEGSPFLGSPEAITTVRAALDYQWLHSRQFLYGENLFYVLIALLSFLLWLRRPSRWLLFWMTGFAIVPPINLLLLNAHIPLPYCFTMGAAQPLSSIRDISLWFLLLWLLLLHQNRTITRLTRILACLSLASTIIDGALVTVSWNPRWIGLTQAADALSTSIYIVLEAFPLVLVSCAFFQRRQLDSARLLVAILAFLNEMILVFRNTVKQGRQFTGWSIGSTIDAPLFTVGGSAISLYTLASALLLIAIVYAVYSSIREDQRRQDALEREKIELTHAREQMRHYAEHDGLTGLWNHRIIVERLRAEVERSRRDGTPLSLVMADIDHFKKINDNFGHLAGDVVLKEISEIFTSAVRTYDWVGRYGGEEFLLILPGSGMQGALARAEQLRQAVQSAQIAAGNTTLEITASFGVASDFPPDCEPETVIQIVDAALYRAKDGGRNCVIAAQMDMWLSPS